MDAASADRYAGSELELFSAVLNWKAYWCSRVRPYIAGEVLEVGAGIGSNTRLLDDGASGRWTCLEPDPGLCVSLRANVFAGGSRRTHECVCGTLAALVDRSFDTIVYIDVLEHIEDDRGELDRAAQLLRPGGHLVVLAPAHNALFSAFDAAIGHFRRYDRAMLRAIAPAGVAEVAMPYLDCAGLLLSAANRLLLRQSMPTKAQLHFWDTWIIPVSRMLDPLLRYSAGKTVIAVWRRPVQPGTGRSA
jgi:SAM-dependent methyltransferase